MHNIADNADLQPQLCCLLAAVHQIDFQAGQGIFANRLYSGHVIGRPPLCQVGRSIAAPLAEWSQDRLL